MMDIEFENRLRTIANGMEYPRTPDIAESVMTQLRSSTRPRFALKRLAWSLTILLVLLSSLMLIPTVRAAVIEFIQIGIIRIFPQPIEPTVEAITTATPGEPLPPLIPFLENIAGKTELVDAQQLVEYPILLPTYPPELGQPNYVYVQDAEGMMTILVWMDPGQPERVAMSLHFIPQGSWAINKFGPVTIQETEVNGQRAIWAVGPYPLWMQNGNIQVERLIDGHVLIWSDGDVTYRLETDLPLEEAIRIAESLEPAP
jgi:hypothetical protein